MNKLIKIVKIPRVGSDNYVPTNEEVVEIYGKIKNEKIKMIFKLFAFSGIRTSEAFELLTRFDRSKLIVSEKYR